MTENTANNVFKLDRRSAEVSLYQGSVMARLDELTDLADAAERSERVGPKRAGTKSKAMAYAKEHDDLTATAEANALHIKVWAISRRDWAVLADEHEPREDEKQDAVYGVNMKTFPDGLVVLAMLGPGEGESYESRVKLGTERLDALGDLSQVQWMKVMRAAWDINVEDDALPKSSLVSLLLERKEHISTRQRDSE